MNIPIGCLVKIHLLKLIYAHELNQAEINLCAYMTITSRGYAGYILFCSLIDHWWLPNYIFFSLTSASYRSFSFVHATHAAFKVPLFKTFWTVLDAITTYTSLNQWIYRRNLYTLALRIHILRNFLIFSVTLTRKICLTIRSFLNWFIFSFFSSFDLRVRNLIPVTLCN